MSKLATVRNTPIITAQQKGRAHRTTSDLADSNVKNPCNEVSLGECKEALHAPDGRMKVTKPPDNSCVIHPLGAPSNIHPLYSTVYRRRAGIDKYNEFMDAGKTEIILSQRYCTGFVIQLIRKREWASDEGVRYWRCIKDGSSKIDHTFESFKDLKEFEESMRIDYIRDLPGVVKVNTGLASLDKELAGMPLGSLVLITGKFGAGKTVLADQIYRAQSNQWTNQWKTGLGNTHSYNDLGAAVADINAHNHLVVFDDLMTYPFDDVSLLRKKLKVTKLIDWAILTVPTNRQGSLSDPSPSRMADYVFYIEKHSHSGWFKIKCLKNRWGTSHPHGIIVKIKTTTHLEEV